MDNAERLQYIAARQADIAELMDRSGSDSIKAADVLGINEAPSIHVSGKSSKPTPGSGKSADEVLDDLNTLAEMIIESWLQVKVLIIIAVVGIILLLCR
jgi:hypothetical protein